MKINHSVLLALALLPFAANLSAQEATTQNNQAAEQKVQAAPVEKKAAPAEKKAETDKLPEQNVPAKPAPKKTESPEIAAKKAAQREIQLAQAKKSKIEATIALEQSRLRQKLAMQNDERIRKEVKLSLQKAKESAEHARQDELKRTLDAEIALANARNSKALFEQNARNRSAELDNRITRAKQELKMGQYNLELTRARLQESNRAVATTPIEYLKDPVKNGTLYISDRRIEFNGPVTERLAEFVVDRINFFNNKSTEYPIFIVIDSSPGGSAFAGYQILKAMESSKAPICVVLKSYCASMAAIITTLAQNSYCYENSTILHHQASTGLRGNTRELEEQLKDSKFWTGRLFAPVCKKLGVTEEEFVKDMYAHVSTGDWAIYGTEAVQRKWVNTVVDKMVENGIVRNNFRAPQAEVISGFVYQHNDLVEKKDERGNTYYEVPALKPGDAWLIHDPENRYRLAR